MSSHGQSFREIMDTLSKWVSYCLAAFVPVASALSLRIYCKCSELHEFIIHISRNGINVSAREMYVSWRNRK